MRKKRGRNVELSPTSLQLVARIRNPLQTFLVFRKISKKIPVLQEAMTLEQGSPSSIYQWNNQHPISKCHVSFWVFVNLKFESHEPSIGTSKTPSHWCFQQVSSWTNFLENIFPSFFVWGQECVSPFLPAIASFPLTPLFISRCLFLSFYSTNAMFLLFSHLLLRF